MFFSFSSGVLEVVVDVVVLGMGVVFFEFVEFFV